MNKSTATGILIALYIFGVILVPVLYYVAQEYYRSIYFFVFAFPVSLFANYIFIINIIIAKITKQVKQSNTKKKNK